MFASSSLIVALTRMLLGLGLLEGSRGALSFTRRSGAKLSV